MSEFEAQVLADLNVLKCQMEQVMGIGQPGRLHQLEARVSCSEESVQKMRGFMAAVGTVLTILHLTLNYLNGKHH